MKHRTRWGALALAVCASALARAADTTPPGAIVGLTAARSAVAPELHALLGWNAPASDGAAGGAVASYDLRYRTDAPVTEANWSTATAVAGEPTPAAPGTRQTLEVIGLKPGTTYYWGIKSTDAAGNVGPISLANPSSSTPRYEGYGSAATGGGGKPIVHVTNLSDGGAGSFRDAVSAGGDRTVVFDVGGTITMNTTIQIGGGNITIDGSTAPSPGITIKAVANLNDGLRLRNLDNVIITYLRFEGVFDWTSAPNDHDLMATNSTDATVFVSNTVLDHLTVRNAGDAAIDLWDRIQDLTMSHCYFLQNFHPVTMGGDAPSARMSIHHNVWAKNGERQPQMTGVRTDMDVRNDVHYDWSNDPNPGAGYTTGSYSVRIRNNATGTGHDADANIINNYFIAGSKATGAALVYGSAPGPDPGEENGPASCLTQGSVYTGGLMGQLRVAGNVFSTTPCDVYSTVAAERPVPAANRVTTDPASALRTTVLGTAGTRIRRADESSLLDTVNTAMGGGAVCGNGRKETGEICDGSDLGGGTCASQGLGAGTLLCRADCLAFETIGCGAGSGGSNPSAVANLRRTDTHP